MTPLTWAQVDAWRVERHHLATPAPAEDVTRVASDILGVHTQLASAAELILGIRVNGLAPGAVRQLVADRMLIKTWATRGTLHLIPAADLPLFFAAMSLKTAWRGGVWLRGHGVTLEEMESILAALPEALDGRILSRDELADELTARVAEGIREKLLSGWGALLKPAANQGLLCFGPSRGNRVTFARPDQFVPGWAPSPLSPHEAVKEVARRFLHTYGPSKSEGFAAWWGIVPPPARALFGSLGEEIVPVDIEGWRTFVHVDDLESLQRQRVAEEPSVRLLPNFDAYVMGYQPRSRFVAPEFKARVSRAAGWISPVLLVDGVARGVWSQEKRIDGVTINVEPFAPLAPRVVAALEAEVGGLGRVLGTAASLGTIAS